jgi:hypothetical protein
VIIRAAIAAASTCLGCVCIFGRSYGPSEKTYLHDLPSGLKESMLSKENCRALCGGSDGVESCAIVTLELPTRHRLECSFNGNIFAVSPEEPFDDKMCEKSCHGATACRELPAGLPGERVLACVIYTPGGCDMSFGHGRRTRTVRVSRARSVLDRMAAAEAASVLAFRAMARELERFGAPRGLIEAARRSAREERQHTRAMIELGARPPKPRARRRRGRSLYAFARENLREGVIGETIGAAFLHSAGLTRIAREEQRHAELSLRVHRWALTQLTSKQRDRLAQMRVVVRSSPLVPDAVAAHIVATIAGYFASAPSKNTASSARV